MACDPELWWVVGDHAICGEPGLPLFFYLDDYELPCLVLPRFALPAP